MSGTATLLQALAGSKRDHESPYEAIARAMGGHSPVFGHAGQAPPPVNPPQPTGAVGTTNPAAAARAYHSLSQRQRARRTDPQGLLGERAGMGAGAPSLLAALGQQGSLVTHGANAGQYAERYDLGDGRQANVYYDDRGRRRVNVFQASPLLP